MTQHLVDLPRLWADCGTHVAPIVYLRPPVPTTVVPQTAAQAAALAAALRYLAAKPDRPTSDVLPPPA